MSLYALSAIGRDRPGIVAAVSRVLLDREINIEDSQMTILRGHFAMTLIVSAPEKTDIAATRADLDQARAALVLEAISLDAVEDASAGIEPSHIVSVYGVDHPGIVHAVSERLAERGWSITDLDTRLVGEDPAPLYVMMIELALPPGTSTEDLVDALAEVGRREGVEISAHELDETVL